VVVQKNHLLLRFAPLRLVVNGMQIYPLRKNKPVLITMNTTPSRIVVTDGFHITQPLELKYNQRAGRFDIVCAVDNDVLVGGLIFMLMFFAMGATSGVLLLQFFSFLPLGYILFLYYIRRKEFIQIRPS
jgi:hypothetical protein